MFCCNTSYNTQHTIAKIVIQLEHSRFEIGKRSDLPRSKVSAVIVALRLPSSKNILEER